jgi:hypothetical protein
MLFLSKIKIFCLLSCIFLLSSCAAMDKSSGYPGIVQPIDNPIILKLSPVKNIKISSVTKTTNYDTKTDTKTDTTEKTIINRSVFNDGYSLHYNFDSEDEENLFGLSLEFSPDGTIFLGMTTPKGFSEDLRDMLVNMAQPIAEEQLSILNIPLKTGTVIDSGNLAVSILTSLFKPLGAEISDIKLGGACKIIGKSIYRERSVVVSSCNQSLQAKISLYGNDLNFTGRSSGYGLYDIETGVMLGSGSDGTFTSNGQQMRRKEEQSLLSFVH